MDVDLPPSDDAKKAKTQSSKPQERLGPSDGVLMGLGLNLTGIVIVFLLVGWWLDSKFAWSPWGMVSLGGLGLALGLYQLVRETNR